MLLTSLATVGFWRDEKRTEHNSHDT